jgi:hypothetical protein
MKRALIATLIFAMCFLSGCATISKSAAPAATAALQPSAVLRFMDIPVPKGFHLLADDSYAFENAGLRMAMLRYKGAATVEQVVEFYKLQMPKYHWTLLNLVQYGQTLMNFDQENATCVISLAPKFYNSVLITISLAPKPPQILKK